ncbi:MAG: hypothetical protein EA357_10630 [Micavibrio sp.]|nr:MAG: hypothetical protein EA357_10630 [Micavibrio sp.]
MTESNMQTKFGTATGSGVLAGLDSALAGNPSEISAMRTHLQAGGQNNAPATQNTKTQTTRPAAKSMGTGGGKK